MAIWVLKDGQREGPYEERDLRELVYEGTYSDMEPAIRDGQFDWTTLGEILGRRTLPPAPEPPPIPPVPEPAAVTAVASEPVVPPSEPPPIPAAEPAPAEFHAVTPPPQPLQVAVTDFDVPFSSMVVLMVKWVLASIPALLILGAIAGMFWIAFFAFVSVVFRH